MKKYDISRPFDLLDQLKGEKINVSLHDKTILVGILEAFDVHLNTVLHLDDGTYLLIPGHEIAYFKTQQLKGGDIHDHKRTAR